jgi:hypothetical protein
MKYLLKFQVKFVFVDCGRCILLSFVKVPSLDNLQEGNSAGEVGF